MKKITSVLIIILNICIIAVTTTQKVAAEQLNSDWIFDLGQFRDGSYYRVQKNWHSNSAIYQGSELKFNYLDADYLNPSGTYENEWIILDKNDKAVIEVEVDEVALYHIRLEYEIREEFSTASTIELLINNEIQYNELTELPLSVRWKLEQRTEDDRYNRYGNEMLPKTISETTIYNEALIDANGRYSKPYYFKLNSGKNTISIEALNQQVLLKSLTLFSSNEPVDYKTYSNNFNNQKLTDDTLIIEGQDLSYKNDIEVKPGYYKGAGMSPTAYKTTVLNVLDGSSMSRSGTSVTYTFDVNETGYYKINFKYLQLSMVGMSSARRISIDNEVLFKELEVYHFAYNKNWKNHTLGNEDGDFVFYLEAGTHELKLEVTTAHLIDYIDRLYQVMDRINSIGFSISQLTGNSQDVLIDWDILKFIPTLKEELIDMAAELESIYDAINAFTPEHDKATSASTLMIASKQLERLSKNPNRIPNKLPELNKGSGSAYQLIGEAINQMTQQPLTIDRIYFYGNDKAIPKANPNIFTRFWFGFKSFVYSFFDKRYKMTNNPDDVLEVWVGQSSLYLDIMQNLIDDEFTAQTGIKVQLAILPNTQKLILNHATKTNPDVVLSIDSWEPYTYALRGMLADLRQFEAFSSIAENYEANNFTPLIFEDGVYGIPETQSVYLMYYRKDILNFLGITPPNTWEEVLNILPILQSYQMNFFHPLGGEGAYKGFGLTSPLIYQMGAEIYSDIPHQTTFNQEKTIEAITFLTDIFNKYNLPQQVTSFFEHFRSGSLPVGISTVDLYLQLKYAAPELSGQWDVLQIPGMYDDALGEVARWAPTYGKASILLADSNMPNEGFELIQWWNKKETQLTYLENIKMILGERFLFLPAGMDALEASVWDQTIKDQALLQARWSRIPDVTPGGYIIERELTNIWNKIVIDKVNPRIAIDQSVPRINRELQRKFEEFGYLEGGEVVHAYIIPRNDNIKDWLS